MTKYKAVIKFLEEPMRIIKWFTKNFDDEVGALGIGELKDGIMVIERLVFPKQLVNGVHVHFTFADWAPIIRELSVEDVGKIIFYWHKHPGDAGASDGDETDTFDTFMPEKDCPRPFFGFMQTATTYSGNFEYEARIEMRDPIWTTIEDVKIMTDEDYSAEEECRKIIKERITFGNATAEDQPTAKSSKSIKTTKIETIKEIADDNHDNTPTFEVCKKNGNVELTVSEYFEGWITDILAEPGVDCWIKKYKKRVGDTKITFDIQPTRKNINSLFDHFHALEKLMELSETTETDLENTINEKDVYTEEKDIKNFNQNVGRNGYGRNNYI